MTNEESIFARNAGKDVLLDSNLLLLFVSGSVDFAVLSRFKRVSRYSPDDYELLARLLSSFRRLITTPHILTEVSNLANSLPGNMKARWFEKFASLVTVTGEMPHIDEEWIPADRLARLPEFIVFGITDAALSLVALKVLVVTEDYRLSGVLRSRDLPVLNFNDLRRIKSLANG